MCGLEEAPTDFDEHVGKVVENLSDESGSLLELVMLTEPAAFQSKLTGVTMCKHHDGISVAPSEALSRTLAALGKVLLLKISSPKMGQRQIFLGDRWSRQSGDSNSSRLTNSSTVCCQVLVLGAALLYTLRCQIRDESAGRGTAAWSCRAQVVPYRRGKN